MTEEAERIDNQRVSTGISGLDTVLRGGLLKAGVYMIRGTPGAGKTTLASQACFHCAASGERALFVTLLSESHARLIQHLETFSFFDASYIPRRLYFLSGFHALEREGILGIINLLRDEMRAFGATMLVLDGMSNLDDSTNSGREIKKFIHELQAYALAMNCTVLLLTSGSRELTSPEYTMVDGVFDLDIEHFISRSEHVLRVRKFRGSSFISGTHFFRITDNGFVVYPRIESVYRHPGESRVNIAKRLSTGLSRLDEMMHGGLPEASTTLVLGPTGIGKTTLGLHFIAEATRQEPALIFGFYEQPQELLKQAKSYGLDIEPKIETGAIQTIWQSPVEQIIDDLGHQLVDAVRNRNVKRLFIDGLGGFEHTALHQERIRSWFTALTNELRRLGVTTIYTWEQRDLVGSEVKTPISDVSVMMQNLVLLRYFELQSKIHRVISILKMRGTGFDSEIRKFNITDAGFEITEPVGNAEMILSGHPQLNQLPGGAAAGAERARSYENRPGRR